MPRALFAIAPIALLSAISGLAQQPASAPTPRPGPAPLQVPNPHYVTVPMTIDVNAPVDKVWARIGKYCDIGEWGIPNCTILSGDGGFGTVRSIGNEILVGKTDLSYIYTQPLRTGQFYPLYHGTVEAKPVTATTSKLIYSLMWDASNLADDAAREANKTQRATQFQGALNNMKILAEGGTLPPRGGGGGGGQRRGQ